MSNPADSTPEEKLLLQETKAHSKKYAERIFDLVRRHTELAPLPANRQPAQTPARKPAATGLLLLRYFPFLLTLVFVFSFFWDFDGVVWEIGRTKVSAGGLLRILSISGLIGYLTNWLAITMLFRPVYKRPLLGQGLIPAQKKRIAERLSDAVSAELINAEVIRHKLQDQKLISTYRARFVDYSRSVIDNPEFRAELKQLLAQYMDDLLGNPAVREIIAKKALDFIESSVEEKSVEKFAFKTYKLLRGDEASRVIERAIADLPSKLHGNLNQLDQVLDQFPLAIEENAEVIENWAVSAIVSLIQTLDIRAIVVDNLYQYDEQRFERLIKGSTNEQLQYIQYLGAVLGTIGGLVIWQPLPALAALTFVSLSVFGIDAFLWKMRNQKAAP
jgi:uncharacterized membrane-anchored protein YjiN (DUF445 family)